MSNGEISIGEALVGLLEAYGIDTVFGIPGVHNVELYRALPRSGITHILPRHEQGAGFMADGYARATGKPAACFTITGPGLTNILTPMGQAWSDSVPMLVISSSLDVNYAAQGRGRLHEMRSQLDAARSCTGYAATCFSARDVQDKLAEAFAMFASARPRPAYIEIPLDVLKLPAGKDWQPRPCPAKPQASANDVSTGAAMLSKAQAPVIVLGGGARDAGGAAVRIAETTGAAIFTTVSAKGAVPDDHPLLAGALLPSPRATKIIMDADLVLAAGTELSETDLWYQRFEVSNDLIRIDLDPSSLVRPYRAALPIVADADATLGAIANVLGDAKNRTPERAAQVAELREGCAGDADELRTQLTRVLKTVRASLPQDAVIATDMTQIAYAANEVLPVSQPACYMHPVGFGTLGYALPAAIGARAGLQERAVVAIAGDYGFQYTCNELGTAAELERPLVILLWNNNSLEQIRGDMIGKGIQPNGVSLVNPDFPALARAYGCPAVQPATLDELTSEIKQALSADGPVLIEIGPAIVKA